jgi:hypothetical protein
MLITLNGADLFHSPWNTQGRVDATRHAGPVSNPIRAFFLKNGINNNHHIRSGSPPPKNIECDFFYTPTMNGVAVGGIVKSWKFFSPGEGPGVLLSWRFQSISCVLCPLFSVV